MLRIIFLSYNNFINMVKIVLILFSLFLALKSQIVQTPWNYWNSLAQNGVVLNSSWCWTKSVNIGVYKATRVSNQSYTQTGNRPDQYMWPATIPTSNGQTCSIKIFCAISSTARNDANGNIFCYRNMANWNTTGINYPQKCIPNVVSTCSIATNQLLGYLKQRVNLGCSLSTNPNSVYSSVPCCYQDVDVASPADEVTLNVASTSYWLKNIQAAC